MAVWYWFLHVTGVDAPGSHWYNFWSGFGSDLGEMAIAVVVWHKVNCSAKGCWRIGLRHSGEHVVCHKHHPLGQPTAQTIADAHEAAQ
jgi:hypothetical protein